MQAPRADLVHRPEGLGAGEGSGGAVDVGDPADGLLQVGTGVRDHVGVEADAGEHDEGVLLLGAVLPGHPRPADVDRMTEVAEGGADHLRRVGQRQPEIPGEEVPGAARQDGEGDPRAGDGLRDGAHRPVSAGHEHHIHAARQCLGRRPLARILHGRRIEGGVIPSRLSGQIADLRAQALPIDLHGVVHERRLLQNAGTRGHGATLDRHPPRGGTPVEGKPGRPVPRRAPRRLAE